jgi:hypothetical protein
MPDQTALSPPRSLGIVSAAHANRRERPPAWFTLGPKTIFQANASIRQRIEHLHHSSCTIQTTCTKTHMISPKFGRTASRNTHGRHAFILVLLGVVQPAPPPIPSAQTELFGSRHPAKWMRSSLATSPDASDGSEAVAG